VHDVAAVLEDRPRDARVRCRELARLVGFGGGAGEAGDARLDGLRRYPRCLRDLAHAGARVAPLGEQIARGTQDLTATPTENHTALAATFVEKLEQAWNNAAGAAFGAQFADESDFLNVRGEHHRGATAIARGHQWHVSSPPGSSWPSRARPSMCRLGR
jgi:hypothetical protein